MKVLFAGPYRDGTGWGHAAQEYILALDTVGVDVVPRAIKLNDAKPEIPKRIQELEKKSDKKCNIIIQNILPHMMDYCGHFEKNIGLYFTETSHFKNTRWAEHLNLMNEAWVSSMDSAICSLHSHVEVPINIVPVPCDVGKYTKRYEQFPIPDLNDRFTFYFIGEYSRRKNLTALLKAYHLEFHPHEPVILVLKSHASGMSTIESSKELVNHCNEIKKQLNLYNRIQDYLDEIIITQPLTEKQIMELHASCDCFVMPSFGEGFCIPAFDAMAMGKTPICTNTGGMKDFLNVDDKQTAGWLISAFSTPCFGMTPWAATSNLYVGNEHWQEINIDDLRKAMREAYENKELRQEKANLGIDRAYDFSYEVIGNQMKEFLNGQGKATFHDRSSKVRENHRITGMVTG